MSYRDMQYFLSILAEIFLIFIFVKADYNDYKRKYVGRYKMSGDTLSFVIMFAVFIVITIYKYFI